MRSVFSSLKLCFFHSLFLPVHLLMLLSVLCDYIPCQDRGMSIFSCYVCQADGMERDGFPSSRSLALVFSGVYSSPQGEAVYTAFIFSSSFPHSSWVTVYLIAHSFLVSCTTQTLPPLPLHSSFFLPANKYSLAGTVSVSLNNQMCVTSVS